MTLLRTALVAVALLVACTSAPPAPATPSATPSASAATTPIGPTSTPSVPFGPTATPTPTTTPMPTPTRVEPAVVWFETVGQGFHRLYRWVLDGTQQAELVLDRAITIQDSDEAGWHHYSISPDGRHALASSLRHDPLGWQVEAFDLESRATLWASPIETPGFPVGWSADGSQAVGELLSEVEPARATLIDVVTGEVRMVQPPDGTWIEGFRAEGHHLVISSNDDVTYRDSYRDWDPATGAVLPLAAVDADIADQVRTDIRLSASRGLWVGSDYRREGDPVTLYDFATGRSTDLVGLPAAATDSRVATTYFDPSGTHLFAWWYDDQEAGVPPTDGIRLYVASPPGPARMLWEGRGHAWQDLAYSPSSELVGFQPFWRTPTFEVVEVSTGHHVELAIPTGVYGARLVTLENGALPAAVPAPPPVDPGPTEPPKLVRGAPRVILTKPVVADDGTIAVRLTVAAPARDRTLAVTATTTIALTDAVSAYDASPAVLPRPGSDEIVVLAQKRGYPTAWTWIPGQEPRRLALPAGLRTSESVTWSLDGTLLMGMTWRSREVWWFHPESGRSDSVPISYFWSLGWLIGVTADDGLVLAPPPAADSPVPCKVDHVVDVHTGAFGPYLPPRPMTAQLRSTGVIVSIATGYGAHSDDDGRHLELVRGCPAHRESIALVMPEGARELWHLWSRDGRKLFINAAIRGERMLLRYRDPWVHPDRLPEVIGSAPAVRAEWFAGSGRWLELRAEWTIDCVQTRLFDTRSGTIYAATECGSMTAWLP